MNQYLSDLDTNRFGVLTVKADAFEIEEQIEECFSFCRENNAALLIARTDASNTKLTHAMERNGALLCDTLVYYEILTRKALVRARSYAMIPTVRLGTRATKMKSSPVQKS